MTNDSENQNTHKLDPVYSSLYEIHIENQERAYYISSKNFDYFKENDYVLSIIGIIEEYPSHKLIDSKFCVLHLTLYSPIGHIRKKSTYLGELTVTYNDDNTKLNLKLKY